MTSDNRTKIEIFLSNLDNYVTNDNLKDNELNEKARLVIPFLSLPFTYKGLKSKVIHYSFIDDQIVFIHNECQNGSGAKYLTFKEFFETADFD